MKRQTGLILAAALLLAPPAFAQQPTLEEALARIDRLESLREIEQGIYEYSRAVDVGDIDSYVGLFAPDGVWAGGGGVFEGQDAIRAMLRGFIGDGPRPRVTGFHMMSAPQVRLAEDGQSATAVSRWTFNVPGETGAPAMALGGRYFDHWARLPEGWRIARREAPSDIPFDDLSEYLGRPAGTD